MADAFCLDYTNPTILPLEMTRTRHINIIKQLELGVCIGRIYRLMEGFMNATGDRRLVLEFHGRIIDHLGIQMYQSPVASIAELIANAWDADSERVEILIPDELNPDSQFVIEDDGIGMTFDECQTRYLKVGLGRRGENPDEKSVKKGRPILGRKGIGKFAGFGIAERIRVETVSEETGEKTIFEMDLNSLRGDEYIATTEQQIPLIEYLGPDDDRCISHGTKVVLSSLKMNRRIGQEGFLKSMARRFLLHERSDDFVVSVNGQPLPQHEELERDVEFAFPRDYKEGELPEGTVVEGDWGITELPGGQAISWQILFYKSPIDEEELRGVSVFSKGKMAQNPFFFNLSGGLGGQHGLEYLSGRVEADYIDMMPEDIIATERQRINWDHPDAIPLEEWGQGIIRSLLRIWRDRRAEERQRKIVEKVAGFSNRLERLQPREKRIVESALHKLATVAALSEDQFSEIGEALLQAWEQGRLRGLIQDISEVEEMNPEDLLSILVEANILTALNTAEAVRTKILTIGGLKLRIEKQELERVVRDYIAENPWLISPQWETFRVETTVRKLLEEAAQEAEMVGEAWEGRIDLALYSGSQLLILEFMRPGLKLDRDHIDRYEKYIDIIRTNIEANTKGDLRSVTGYLVADKLADDSTTIRKIHRLEGADMYTSDWSTLLARAVAGMQEYLEIVVGRAPDDERLQALTEYKYK